jgi:hypothetical protein
VSLTISSLKNLNLSNFLQAGRTLVASGAAQTINLVAADLNRNTLLTTSTYAFTLAYPGGLTPQANDRFNFVDTAGTWGTNNVTVTGFTLHGTVQNLVLNLNYGHVVLTYVNPTVGWTVDIGVGVAATSTAPLNAPALTGAATVDGLPVVKYDPTSKQLLTSTGTNVSTLMSPPVSNIVYTAGKITSYQIGAITYTITYDSLGRASTISDGTLTQTLTYNADGTVAGLT